MKVTLKQLREHNAPFSVYNKVVRSLQNLPFSDADEGRETYIRLKHTDPVPLEAILASNGLEDALWATRCLVGRDRDLRLYAVWCVRQVQHLLKDARSLEALDVAEAFANGLATKDELDAAYSAAYSAYSARAADAADADAAAYAAYDAYAAYAAYDAYAAARAAAYDAYAAARAANAANAADARAAYAAYDAAYAAARAAQQSMLIKMCRGEAPWQQ